MNRRNSRSRGFGRDSRAENSNGSRGGSGSSSGSRQGSSSGSGRNRFRSRSRGFGQGGPRQGSGGGKQNWKSPRIQGSSLRIDQLVNKVNEEALVKPIEHDIKNQFKDFLISPKLLNNIEKKGYKTPTPIQDIAIPVALEGRDVIGLANTGTGKTAAFLIPLINKVLNDRSQQVLIMAPTRELAVQINDELKGFVAGLGLYSVLCIGGSNIAQQGREIRRPFNFIIGTPGRIMDLEKRRWLYLDRFQNVVLDEADRMVDMGFINDIKLILGKLPKNRHSLFFTATLVKSVEDLIQQFLTSPVKVSVKTRDTSANIEQDIIQVANEKSAKLQTLKELLQKPDFDKVIVFGRTKFGVDRIAKGLKEYGIRADAIHGDKSQNFRLKALQAFKRGDIKVLAATDVAARGLDINGVSHVINFDLPANYEDYVHRIGRTGRADKKGIALTFITK